MTVYECPRCGKNLVTEEEPPGIIHKCDDCVERMIPAGEECNDCTVSPAIDQSEGGGERE